MLGKVWSAAVRGIEARTVEVEVNVKPGSPHVVLVGLPDAAVRESLERVRTAIENAGYQFPTSSILTINLAPAHLRKEGPVYDLPIAIGLLAATGQVKRDGLLRRYALLGELALDSRARPVKGGLAMAVACRDAKLAGLLVPADNAPEVGVVEGLEAIPITDLTEAVGFLNGERKIPPLAVDLDRIFDDAARYELDFGDVKGQEHVKRALTVAAAGGHNCLLIGPPGSGKTMLARRVPTLLPRLSRRESLETTKIHSVAGLLPAGGTLLAQRPFRAPHHTVSDAGLVGGGSYPRPGEISLAHHGVLFLDELPEFARRTLEVLRQPLEDGVVTIGRAAASITYPAAFMLLAAMNPCPCGYLGDPRRACSCSPREVQGYRSKISGPLLDRIDLHVEVPALSYRELVTPGDGVRSADMRRQVEEARARQERRYQGERVFTNAALGPRQLKKHCKLGEAAEAVLRMAMERLNLSARAHSRVLKVARTIADLAGAEELAAEHVGEAVQYRTLDRGAGP
ncbi:MAG: YifB family Mg chelatase-like AAA ATPase [Planctomycetes bacterium]|nr:YifB family Mg chelatase-like AAA ATPase [Planctomycetota bacterium]